MRKMALIGLTFVLPIILVILLMAREAQFPPDARDDLAAYLGFSAASQGASLDKILRAAFPWNFRPSMSAATFGHSLYFETTYSYDASPGPKPPPYPPGQIWCVTLSQPRGRPGPIFIALHSDLYNADWIVHELQDPAEAFEAVGCDLQPGSFPQRIDLKRP